ncbi:MAG: FAD-dependent oxidoreductase [Dokdonella sp.]
MSENDTPPSGPDLGLGVAIAEVPPAGVLAGHVAGEAVLLSRKDAAFFAVSGTCTHYGAALAQGRFDDGMVRCPWHHACFSLRSGEALAAPAFAALASWRVEVMDGRVFVREKMAAKAPSAARAVTAQPARIVVVGGGAAAFAAAEKLRRLGFAGSLSLLSHDAAAPCDRPNLSKDYLAGSASADWIPLQSDSFYAEHRIDLHLGCEVTAIDVQARSLALRSGETLGYDALLIATGAEPVRMPVPGFERPNVFALRTLADADAIIAAALTARSVVFIGAGFIGLEAAAALRTRGLDVHVVAREAVPMERVFGTELATGIADVHRANGVVWHRQRSATHFDGSVVTLDDGTRLPADFVVVGIGVKPRSALASAAGLAVHDGIVVDRYLQTSAAQVFAAGDVARFARGDESLRIEHWVVAERQGQVAAANMLGLREPFEDVPFFWTHHFDLDVRYIGHAEKWDEVRIDGSVAARDCTARFFRGGHLLAAASIGRDRENLEIGAQLAPPVVAAQD